MKHSILCAFFVFLALLCAACSNMGGASDPALTEGVFSFYLPPEINFTDPTREEPVDDVKAENDGEDNISSADAVLADAEPAPVSESTDGEGTETAVPAAPLVAVARWSVSLVSALGFEHHETIAPSEKPVLLTVQTGQWKILVIAENDEGEIVASCELNGVSLSAEEEKPVPLKWQLPEEPVQEEQLTEG